jgi:hypothetical protein
MSDDDEFRPPLPEGWMWDSFENEGNDWWATAKGHNTIMAGHMVFPRIVGHGTTRQEAIDKVFEGIKELGPY